MRNVRELLRSSWGDFTTKPKLYVSIYLLPLLFSLLFIYFDQIPESDMSTVENIALVLVILVTMVVNLMMGVALILTAAGRTNTFMEAYQTSIKYIWRYLFVGIVGGLAVLLGLILFIIPGIIVAVWFSQAYVVAVMEDKGVIASLKKSKEYVTGKWWAVAWRIIALIAIMIVVTSGLVALVDLLGLVISEEVASVAVYLANCVIVPFSIIYSYQLYKDLSSRNNPTVSTTEQVNTEPSTEYTI